MELFTVGKSQNNVLIGLMCLILLTAGSSAQSYQIQFSLSANYDTSLRSNEYFQLNFQVGEENRDIKMTVTLSSSTTFYLMLYEFTGEPLQDMVEKYFNGDTDEIAAVKNITGSSGELTYQAKHNASFAFNIFTYNLDADSEQVNELDGSLVSSHPSQSAPPEQSTEFSLFLVLGWLVFFILLYRNIVYQREYYLYYAINWIISALMLVIIYTWSIRAYLALLPINLVARMFFYSKIEDRLITIERMPLIESSSEHTKYTIIAALIVIFAILSSYLASQVPFKNPDEFKFWLPIWAIGSLMYMIYAYRRDSTREKDPDEETSQIKRYLSEDSKDD